MINTPNNPSNKFSIPLWVLRVNQQYIMKVDAKIEHKVAMVIKNNIFESYPLTRNN